MSETRKLKTVLFADIAGYTSLMQEDEKHALTLLNRFKDILEKTVPEHEGEITQYFGDGCLLTFDSGTKATSCAIVLQTSFQDEHLPVRIGMHLGDVVFKNNNAFGDGVNIASRVESLGIPGVILLSKAVRDQIKNKPEFQLVSRGHFDFKNVEEPMEVFAIGNEGILVPKRSEMKGKLKPESIAQKAGKNVAIYLGSAWVIMEAANFFIERYNLEPLLLDILIIFLVFGVFTTLTFNFFKGRWNKKAVAVQVIISMLALATVFYFMFNPNKLNPSSLRVLSLSQKANHFQGLRSIAVLPFSNYMGDESQDFLLSGMHDGLISEIGKLGNLRVVSRTSSLPYKNTTKNIPQIAKELEVDAIIETSLTRVDSMVELKMKLINVAPNESILWDHSYSVRTNELPNTFRAATKNIAQNLGDAFLPESEKLLAPQRVPNPGAYETGLRGLHYMGLLTKEGFDLAIQQFERTIKIDSLYAAGYFGLAGVLLSQRQMGFVQGDQAIARLDSLFQKSLSLDSTSSDIMSTLACHYTWTKFEWDQAEKLFTKSIEINPNHAPTRAFFAHFLMIKNRWDEAWEQMDIALELDPKDPWVLGFSTAMYAWDGKILSAGKQAQKMIQLAPEHPIAQRMLLQKHINLNKEEEAIRQLIKLISIYDVPNVEQVAMKGFKQGGFKQGVKALIPLLEAHAGDYFIRPVLMFDLYGYIDNKKKQEEWMMQMYENRDPNLPYYGVKKYKFDSKVREVIMKEIGLW